MTLIEAFNQAVVLELCGDEDAAMDLLWDHLDPVLSRGVFVEVNAALLELSKADKLPPYTALCILAITRPASRQLPHRAAFFARAAAFIEPGELEGLPAKG